MIPHNMTLFKFICVQYQFHRQTLPIMKIDRGQIQFRDYVSTGTEPFLFIFPCCRWTLKYNKTNSWKGKRLYSVHYFFLCTIIHFTGCILQRDVTCQGKNRTVLVYISLKTWVCLGNRWKLLSDMCCSSRHRTEWLVIIKKQFACNCVLTGKMFFRSVINVLIFGIDW